MKLYRIFMYTALILIALSVAVPVLWVLMASVKDNSEFYGNPFDLPEGFKVENFTAAWEKAGMSRYFLNSVTVTLLAMVILLAVAIPASYVLGRGRSRSIAGVRGYLMSGLFVNVSYIVVPIFLMLVSLNRLAGEAVLLNNRLVLALVYASCALPFTVYLLSGYFASIESEFEEAAYVDGCSRWRCMWQIMVPLARAGVLTVVLFNFLSFWNEYIIAITLMTNDAAKTLPVGLMNLMKAQNASAEYGMMYAGLVIVMLPTLLLYIAVQRKLTEGMTVGGVKG